VKYQAQPYRKGPNRPKGAVLQAMLRGKPRYMRHPSTAKRRLKRRNRRNRVYALGRMRYRR